MNSTTLKTISEVLGISISTVSRALKDHPDISDKTKRKVMELAHTLDYEPNANAIQLRNSKSNILGVIVPRISNFFYHFFISSIEEECHRHNYSLMVLQSGETEASEAASLRICRQNRICGIFACLSSREESLSHFDKLRELDIPLVFFDKVPESDRYNKVCVADEASAILAAETLLARNKKQVLAIFGDPKLLITRKRLSAFSKALAGKLALEVAHATDTAEAETITSDRLNNKPDAIFCMSDEILTGVMKAVQRRQLSIPGEIGIISLSNGFVPRLYFPEITYVETSAEKLGKLAFERMLLAMKDPSLTGEHSIETALVAGGSL